MQTRISGMMPRPVVAPAKGVAPMSGPSGGSRVYPLRQAAKGTLDPLAWSYLQPTKWHEEYKERVA